MIDTRLQYLSDAKIPHEVQQIVSPASLRYSWEMVMNGSGGTTVKLSGPGLFRLILAIMVFVSHSTRFDVGLAAVNIFFCLSGYWIFLIWRDRYAFADNHYLDYILARIWRLMPVFLLCSFISWAIYLAYNTPPAGVNWVREIVSSFFILGYHSTPIGPDGPAWSLDVEMQFYLIAPALFAIIRRSVLSLLLVGTISLLSYRQGDHWSVAPYLVFFSLGAASAVWDWKPKNKIAYGSLCLTILLIACCLASPWRGIVLGGRYMDPSHAYNGAASMVLAFCTLPWAIFTAQQVAGSLDRACGDLSYIFYLLHFPVVMVLIVYSGYPPNYFAASRILVEMLALASALGGSLLIWRFYDRPIEAWRNRWKTRHHASKAIAHVQRVQ